MDEHRVDAVAPHDAAPAGANVHDGVVLRPHGVGKRVGPAVDEHADAAGIHRRSAPREVFTEQAMPAGESGQLRDRGQRPVVLRAASEGISEVSATAASGAQAIAASGTLRTAANARYAKGTAIASARRDARSRSPCP